MRGTPWIRFALMAGALALMAIPIWLAIQAEQPSGSTIRETAAPPRERDVKLEIESAPAAQSIGVTFLGQELIPGNQATGSYSGTILLPTGSPADLVVMAEWSGTQSAALRVRVSDDNGPLAEASYWGTDRVQDVFTVPEPQE